MQGDRSGRVEATGKYRQANAEFTPRSQNFGGGADGS
jgi:hypothetical protein